MINKIIEAMKERCGWLVINRCIKTLDAQKSVIVVNESMLIQVTRCHGSWVRMAFKDIGENYNMIERWEVFCERKGYDPKSLPSEWIPAKTKS